jgi:hypothetical protein
VTPKVEGVVVDYWSAEKESYHDEGHDSHYCLGSTSHGNGLILEVYSSTHENDLGGFDGFG